MFLSGLPNDYEGLTEISSDVNRLNVVFKILKKGHGWDMLQYRKLYIPYEKEKIFDAKLKATGLVEFQQRYGSYHPDYKLNDEGLMILDEHESYAQYLESQQPYDKFLVDCDIVLNYLKKRYNAGVIMKDQFSKDTGIDQSNPVLEYLTKKGFIKGTMNDIELTSDGYVMSLSPTLSSRAIPVMKGDTHNYFGNIVKGDGNIYAPENKGGISNETIRNHNTEKSTKSLIEILSWIIGIIAGGILIYEFVIKK